MAAKKPVKKQVKRPLRAAVNVSDPAPVTVAAKKTAEPVKEKKSFFLGGYDAKSCPTLVMKNFHPNYSEQDKDPVPSGALARMEEGVAFEPIVGEAWASALGDRFLVIPACDRSDRSKKLREKLTLKAMRDPGDVLVIWNARLPQSKRTHRTGEPDALVHWGVDDDGTHLWVPVDVKHHKSLEGKNKGRVNTASTFDKPLYQEAATVDLGLGTPRLDDAMQLSHYDRMLRELGHAAPVAVGGIIGKELQILWHDLDAKTYKYNKVSACEIYDEEFTSRLAVAQEALDGKVHESAGPEYKTECAECVWRTSCMDEMRVDLDHITLIKGVTPAVAKAHYSVGVRRISDLARYDWRTAVLIDAKVDVLDLRSWASSVAAETSILESYTGDTNRARETGAFAKAGVLTAGDVLTLDGATMIYHNTGVTGLADAIDRARVYKVGKVFLAREVSHVGINRSVYEQDVDIEDDNGYVYLIGVRTTGRKMSEGATTSERRRGEGRFEYDAFVNWDRSADGEARVFAEFWAHIQASRDYASKRKYAYRLYYYSKHEETAFKRLATVHAGKPGIPTVGDVDALFRLKEVINLYEVLLEQLVWPTLSVGLKEVAKWVRFSWRDSDPGGGNSIAWYRDATEHPEEEVRNENRQRLLEYNEDDVTAQVAVRDWLTRLGEARQPGKRLPNVSTLDRRFSRR
jgi:hypothetical protein